MGDHQYVGKQDGAVKGKTSERLKRHLGSGGAVVHKLQKSTLLRPQRSIFGQVTARLPHHPYGWRIEPFAPQHGKQRTACTGHEIGRASCRARMCKYVSETVVGVVYK